MATYTWMREHGGPLRRRPTPTEIGRNDVRKRCNKCTFYNHAVNRVCVRCRETLKLSRAKRRPLNLDDQLKTADRRISEWHRAARIALGRISKWTKVRDRLMRKKIEEARAAANQDRAPLVRPARRALRVRGATG